MSMGLGKNPHDVHHRIEERSKRIKVQYDIDTFKSGTALEGLMKSLWSLLASYGLDFPITSLVPADDARVFTRQIDVRQNCLSFKAYTFCPGKNRTMVMKDLQIQAVGEGANTFGFIDYFINGVKCIFKYDCKVTTSTFGIATNDDEGFWKLPKLILSDEDTLEVLLINTSGVMDIYWDVEAFGWVFTGGRTS